MTSYAETHKGGATRDDGIIVWGTKINANVYVVCKECQMEEKFKLFKFLGRTHIELKHSITYDGYCKKWRYDPQFVEKLTDDDGHSEYRFVESWITVRKPDQIEVIDNRDDGNTSFDNDIEETNMVMAAITQGKYKIPNDWKARFRYNDTLLYKLKNHIKTLDY